MVVASRRRDSTRPSSKLSPPSDRLGAALRNPLQAQTPLVRQEVLRLSALMQGSCRTIADTFNRRFAAHRTLARRASVGHTFVAELTKANLHEIAMLRCAIKHRVPRPLPRNRVWGVDLTGKGDAVGNVHSILGILDHGSRLDLVLKALKDKASITLLRALLDAIEKYGKPWAVRTDNEAVFTSRLFRFGLWVLGIRHQRIDLSCPWQNGRIERFFGTLKRALGQLAVEGRDGLILALVEFRFFYNHIRPHQHLAGLTPGEVWAGCRWKIKGGAVLNAATMNNRAVAIAALPPVKEAFWFEAWDGLLSGYYLRR